MIQLGDIGLGKIKSKEGFEYQLTRDDLLWAGRMLFGESSSNIGRKAVLWCMAQRLAWAGNRRRGAFKKLVKDYSQPINPKWRNEVVEAGEESLVGHFCHPTRGTKRNEGRCGPDRLARRMRVSTKQWDELPGSLQLVIKNWSEGHLANPVPGAVDFAQARATVGGRRVTTREQALARLRERNLKLVWDEDGNPEGSLEDSNAFYSRTDGRTTRRKSSEWPDGYVFIEYRETTSTTAPVTQGQPTNNPNSSTAPPQNVVPMEQEDRDRIKLMTRGREAPPDRKHQYAVLEGSTDSQSSLPRWDRINDIRNPYDQFDIQMGELRTKSTLELTNTLPAIQIFMQDENGDLVNLNDLIFTRSPLENFSQEKVNQFHPERPIASIMDLSIRVEQPKVGGPTGIMTGKLRLKIHNPYVVFAAHPRGKFIHWMLKQGMYVRVKYGVQGSSIGDNLGAFKIRDEDFIIAQHKVDMKENLEAVLELTIIPATSKLLNQIFVGESIPIDNLSLSSEDVDAAVTAAVAGDRLTGPQRSSIKASIMQFQREFNSAREFVGSDTERNSDGTLSSVLQGALSSLDIIQRPDGFDQVQIRNTIEAIKSIQSSMLSQRFEQIIQENSYISRPRENLGIIAINAGPLLSIMIAPELEKVVGIASRTSLRQEQSRRNQVTMVFGNFNANAGEWSRKPISTFPIDIEEILAHIRRERDIGRFFDTFNSFVGQVFSQMRNRDFFIGRSENRGEDNFRALELPEVKYRIYPDPQKPNNWIFYVYDNKEYITTLQNLLSELGNRKITKDEIKAKCEENKIPWIELGSNTSLVKQMTATTEADDMLMSHNIWQANQAFNERRTDASTNIPAGIDRNFLTGIRDGDTHNIIRATELVMPLHITMEHFMVSDAIIFGHVYLFFPLKQFAGLFTIYELDHVIDKNSAKSKFTLRINMTQRNIVT